MRKGKLIWAAIVALLLLSVSLAPAQPAKARQGGGGWGMGSAYQRLYNPATVETISGIVESVEKVAPMRGMYSGVHLTLKTDKETIPVHLGPAWYIDRLNLKISKGDALEVKGSRISFEGKPAIIAGELKKGDQTLILRDANGIPAWAGWRRR